MARLGLFPLPLVLVPTERISLHIFEPRYRELIGECIERDEEFGIVFARQDGGAYAVGTRAAVVEVLQRMPDGRLLIEVQGGARFSVLEVHDERSFLEGTVEPLLDVDDPPEHADIQKALELFGEIRRTVGVGGDGPDPASPQLDFELASHIDIALEQKQRLLELTSPRERFGRLVDLLEHALRTLTLDRAVMRSASGNGKVTPLSGE